MTSLDRRRVWAWCLFDWANSPYPTRGWSWVAGILIGAFAGPNQAASRSLMERAGVATLPLLFLVGGGLLLLVDEGRGRLAAATPLRPASPPG